MSRATSTSFVAQPNAAVTSSGPSHAMPPELETTLSLLSSHRSVLGYMLLSRGHPVSIIRHSGVPFEGEQGKKYASAIGKIIESVHSGLEEVHGSDHGDGVRTICYCSENLILTLLEQDEIKFMRIRTKRHEIMISPGASFNMISYPDLISCSFLDDRYLLAVLHDPTT
jgi:dynein light chain roadblock-type